MTIVYRGPNLAEAHRVSELLDQHGIAARVDQEIVSSGRKALPLDLTTLSVVRIGDSERAAEAKQLIAELSEPSEGEAWRCDGCGTDLDAAFTACWSCGAERP